jgi:hypothetical protein
MPEQPSHPTTVDEAIEVLLAHQEREHGARTIPARDDTRRTDAGWAFFNPATSAP